MNTQEEQILEMSVNLRDRLLEYIHDLEGPMPTGAFNTFLKTINDLTKIERIAKNDAF